MKLRYTTTALRQIDEILSYMAVRSPRAILLFSESQKSSISLFLRNSGRKTAAHFCWNCSKGASRLRERILTAATLVQDYPDVAQATSRSNVRRLVLHPYPYAIFYRVGAAEVIIMRIRHAARRPVG